MAQRHFERRRVLRPSPWPAPLSPSASAPVTLLLAHYDCCCCCCCCCCYHHHHHHNCHLLTLTASSFLSELLVFEGAVRSRMARSGLESSRRVVVRRRPSPRGRGSRLSSAPWRRRSSSVPAEKSRRTHSPRIDSALPPRQRSLPLLVMASKWRRKAPLGTLPALNQASSRDHQSP